MYETISSGQNAGRNWGMLISRRHNVKRSIFSFLLGAHIVVGSALPASADWQFTKWGMSSEEVVETSKAQEFVVVFWLS